MTELYNWVHFKCNFFMMMQSMTVSSGIGIRQTVHRSADPTANAATHIHTNTYTQTQTHTHKPKQTHTHTHKHTHTHTHKHTQTHARTNTHTHTTQCAHKCRQDWYCPRDTQGTGKGASYDRWTLGSYVIHTHTHTHIHTSGPSSHHTQTRTHTLCTHQVQLPDTWRVSGSLRRKRGM